MRRGCCATISNWITTGFGSDSRARSCNRDAIGAWIEVFADDRVLPRQVMPTRGYLSQSELPVTVGLGSASAVDKVVIHWPGGGTQTIQRPAVDQTHVIEQAP